MNTSEHNWGLPRDLIPWGSTIDPMRCRGSGECMKFCPNSVYEFDAAARRTRVAHFHQCVVMWNNCVAVCPNGAISFPSQDEFLDCVQELRGWPGPMMAVRKQRRGNECAPYHETIRARAGFKPVEVGIVIVR